MMLRMLIVTGIVGAGATTAWADLKAYVSKPDATYRWEKRAATEVNGVEVVELRLISQSWQDIEWKHRLFVARADEAPIKDQAILVISGGSWQAEYDRPAARDQPEFRNADVLVALARRSGMPVVLLNHVPFQPMFDGRKEDEIIAYTFQKFLETKDPEWPLLFPMVKSAVRAMDAVQEFARQAWSLDVERFMVTGGSKRGWTTWLTGAVDERVNAIAPMVIDVLNMGPQMRHQIAAWGRYSEQIHDYTELRIQNHMVTPEGQKLTALVDPFAYRRDLTQPKLIMIGTNDRYWPLDALNLYWDQLLGEKYILYVPNKGHGLDDYERVLSDAVALARSAAGKLTFPELDWELIEADDGLHLTIRTGPAPSKARAWVAHSASRDFREARWRPVDMDADALTYHLDRPKSGYAAMFGEVVYELEGGPLFLCTNVRIIESTNGWKTLFGGNSLSGWSGGQSGAAHEWRVAGGVAIDPANPKKLVIEPGKGVFVNGESGRTADLYSRLEHGDCELHLEFVVPEGSNSGVYFQSRYEIQILDSFDKDKVTSSDCGGVYQRWINHQGVGGRAPDFNASKPPGKWQTFDVVFRAPRFDEKGNKTANARFEKVVHNSVIIHENVELEGPTRGGHGGPEQARAPLRLQGDHGPVAFRNVRIKPLDREH